MLLNETLKFSAVSEPHASDIWYRFCEVDKTFVVEGKVILMHVIKASRGVLGGVELWLLSFLTSALDGGELSASHLHCFIPRERIPCMYQKGGCVCPIVGLDVLVRRKISFFSYQDLNPGSSS